jgi:malonate transporter
VLGVLIGFAIIGTIILIGYLVGRLRLLGDDARRVLSRLVFFVASPCLLLTVLADADVAHLFSVQLLVAAATALAAGILFALIALLVLRRRLSEAVIGSLAASYVNANNIGIPVAVYVVGDAAASAPVLLFQLLVLAPIALTILDVQARGRTSWRRVLAAPFGNPVIVASAIGVVLAVLPFDLATEILEPFRVIGAASVPLMLIGFGMSLHGSRPLVPGSGRIDVLLATAMKALGMPALAWVLGAFAFRLDEQQLFTAVVLAGLPTAQNVFNYAQRYERGEVIARDTILLTTILAVPVLVAVAALLAPS